MRGHFKPNFPNAKASFPGHFCYLTQVVSVEICMRLQPISKREEISGNRLSSPKNSPPDVFLRNIIVINLHQFTG